MLDFKQFLIEMADDNEKFKKAIDDAVAFDLDKVIVSNLYGGITCGDILATWASEFKWEFNPNWYATYANGVIKCRIDSDTGAPGMPGGSYILSTTKSKSYKFTDVNWNDPLTNDEWTANKPSKNVLGIGWFLWWIKHPGAKYSHSGVSSTSKKGTLGDNPKTYFYEQVAAGAFRLFDSNKNYDWFEDSVKNQELLVSVIGSETDGNKKWSDDTWQSAYPKQVAIIANGVKNFLGMNDNVGSSGYSIIHTGIDSYYRNIRGVVDKIGDEDVKRYALDDAKDNTADIVLYSDSLSESDLYDSDNTIQDNPDVCGRLRVVDAEGTDIGWVMQVSLKLSEKEAQVGKLSTDFESSGFLYVSDGDDDLTLKSYVIDKYYDQLPQQTESFIQGFRDFVRTSWGSIVEAFNKALSILHRLQATLLKYLSPNKVKREAAKLLKDYLDDFDYLVEASQKEKVDAIMDNDSFKEKISDDTNLILNSLIEKIEEKLGSNKEQFITSLPSESEMINQSEFDKLDKKYIRNLLCNQVSFRTLLNYYNSITGDYIKELTELGIRIGLNAVMGESLLPVVKLYGAPKGTTVNWIVLNRADEKYNVENVTNIPIGGLTIWRSKQSGNEKKHGYYSINQYSLMSVKNNEPVYMAAQLRTGGSSGGFAFFIEANKTVDKVYLKRQVKND